MLISEERFQKLPIWIKRNVIFMKRLRVPGKIAGILISVLATLWFLIRVIPKPSRATYPCMQIAAPVMSGFVLWIIAVTGAAFAFKNAKQKLLQTKYFPALLFLVLAISSVSIYSLQSDAKADSAKLEIWYKPNIPLGVAKGIFPGQGRMGAQPKVASWDGKQASGGMMITIARLKLTSY